MTDPKNTEQQSEELSLDQLKDAAGGISANARGKTKRTITAFTTDAGGQESSVFEKPKDELDSRLINHDD